jgi:iron(III) transport system permease protein
VPESIICHLFNSESWASVESFGGMFAVYLQTTALVVLLAVLVALVVAAPMAWVVSRYRFAGREFVGFLQLAPLCFSAPELACIYGEKLSGAALQNRLLLGVILGISFSPWVFLILRLTFSELPLKVIEAARTLGAGSRRLFLEIYWPLVSLAFFMASYLIAAMAIGDYGASRALGVPTLSVGMHQQWFAGENSNAVILVGGLAFLIFGAMILVPILVAKVSGGRIFPSFASWNKSTFWNNDRKLRARQLKGPRATGLVALGVLLALPGFILPLVVGARAATERFSKLHLETFFLDCWGSVGIALIVVVVSLVLSLLFVWLNEFGRQGERQSDRLSNHLNSAWLFLAANLLLSPLAFARVILASHVEWGVAPIVVAQVLRFLPLMILPVFERMRHIAPSIIESARTLGFTRNQAYWRVGLRLLRAPLLAGAALILVMSLKELTMTVLLQPFGFHSLALHSFQMAETQQIAEASVWILASGLLALYPVWVLWRSTERDSI